MITYIIRLTIPKNSLDQLKIFIKTISKKFVISHEYSQRHKSHFHLVIDTEVKKSQINKDLTSILKVPIGNAGRSITEARDTDLAVSYAVKDGEYIYEGYTDEYINERKEQSFQKELTMRDKIKQLEQEWRDYKGQYTSKHLTNLVYTRLEYHLESGQSPNIQSIHNWAKWLVATKDSRSMLNTSKDIARSALQFAPIQDFRTVQFQEYQEYDTSALEYE